MSKPIHITDQEFESKVLRSSVPVIVDFWADWCGPCLSIAPLLEEIASEYDGRLTVAKIDVDSNPQMANQYGVRSIPTLILFIKGQPVERLIGYMPKSELVVRIESYLD